MQGCGVWCCVLFHGVEVGVLTTVLCCCIMSWPDVLFHAAYCIMYIAVYYMHSAMVFRVRCYMKVLFCVMV